MCDSGTKVRVFKVTRPDTNQCCIYRDGATLIDGEFDGAEIGDTITIELLEMTEDDLEKLPEFEGW